MKFYFLLLISLLFLIEILIAQNLPEQDCIAAIPVCQDTFVQTIPYVGEGANGNEINNGISCLGGEINDVWYTLKIQTGGKLCFLILPANLNDDYDWAVYNLTSASCSDIYNNSSLEVSCNNIISPNTGASDDSVGLGFKPCIPVNSGETYVLNVSKNNALAGGYTLDFSASSAQIYDVIPPEMLSVSNPVTCSDTQIVVNFSENIFSSSVQPSDFILTGPSGNIAISTVAASNGSVYDENFILTVSPAIAPLGNFSLILNASSVQDLCNNLNIQADTFNFSIVPFPVQTSTTPELCSSKNGMATANPSGGVSPLLYTWNTSPFQNTQTATGLSPGVYAVTITDAVGCVSTAPANVGFDPGNNPPAASISSVFDATCAGINDGSATANATGGITPYSYSWSVSPAQTNATATGLGTGNFTVTVADSLGCYDTAMAAIGSATVIMISAFPTNDTTICNGGTATLYASANGGTTPYSFTWLNGAGANDTISANPVDTTVFSVFATDSSGCKSDTDNITVNVFQQLVADIVSTGFVCIGNSLKLTANATGGNGNYSFSWSNSATGNEIYVSPIFNTSFSVTVTDGCSAPDGIANENITVGQPPVNTQIIANPFSDCIPLDVKFLVEPYVQGYLYTWNFGEGKPNSLTTYDTISYSYKKSGCIDILLKIKTNEGCEDSIIDICKINPLPLPDADFIFSPEEPTILNPLVNFSDQSSGGSNWQWDFGDNQNSSLQNPLHEYPDSGTYIVKLVVENDFQCSDSVEKTVFVDYETSMFIPNCFTPDENGINDNFAPVFEGIKPDGYAMSIFNRNGMLVFQTENINEKWDGKSKGEFAENAVYVYYIKYKPFKGAEKHIRGSVTLLR